ncbi:MAG: alginate export family protein [Myxococcota bacterium]
MISARPRRGLVLAALSAALCAAGPNFARADAGEERLLREQLTEREDENRTREPFTRTPFGHLLTLTAQYVVGVEGTRPLREHDAPDGESRALLSSELETELFFSTGERFSFLAQVVGVWDRDLLASTRAGISDAFVERGELWLLSEGVAGLPLQLEIGRLDFEDDRLWWWDTDLDAARATVEVGSLEVALAAAREVAAERSGAGGIAPEHEGVLRLLAEISWDWAPEHALQLFALHHDDRSRTESVGTRVLRAREDDSDARLTWLGARASGALDLDGHAVGYWLDAGWVHGREQRLDLAAVDARVSVVDERSTRRVDGWAIDLGATWRLAAPLDPRLTAGFAIGSGDRDPDDERDRAFRQTGLHGNAPGYGGVQRFSGYGILLDPELSNLTVATLGAGISLLDNSSIDVAYHGYWQVHASDELRDARLEASLTGASRRLGHGIDLVLGIEEWDALELEVSASVFRAGRAFAVDAGDWAYGGFVELRFAF